MSANFVPPYIAPAPSVPPAIALPRGESPTILPLSLDVVLDLGLVLAGVVDFLTAGIAPLLGSPCAALMVGPEV